MISRSTATLVVAGFFAVAVVGVLLRPLFPIDETRYVAVAWEMWLSGDYFVPTKNFEIYTHKPPLLFWLMNLVWTVTGVSEFWARIVGPAAAVATILMTGRLARRLWPEDSGIGARAMIALAGSLIFAMSGNLTMFDTLLASATVASMLALVQAVETGQRSWWFALGIAIAVGVLAKGPVILFHVAPTALLTLYWGRELRHVSLKEVLIGLLVALVTALLVAALWVGPAALLGGEEYRNAILWTQSAGRVTESFAHSRTWWFYIAILPALGFPWVFIPALWRTAFRMNWSETGLRLATVWGLGGLILFTLISAKQIHYAVPELPAVALLVARLSRDIPKGSVILAAIPILLVAFAAIGVAAGFVPAIGVASVFHPVSGLLVFALLLFAAVGIAVQINGLVGGTTLSLGLVLSINILIGLTDARTDYSAYPIAEFLVSHENDGIAFIGQPYHAEFNFAGRFTTPVSTPVSGQDMDTWIRTHPDGVIVGRSDRVEPGWLPRETISYRTHPYALWYVADAPKSGV